MFDVPTAFQVKEGSTFSDITDNLFIVRGHYHNVLIKSKTQNGMYFDNEGKQTNKRKAIIFSVHAFLIFVSTSREN
jgi:hypothetical protein